PSLEQTFVEAPNSSGNAILQDLSGDEVRGGDSRSRRSLASFGAEFQTPRRDLYRTHSNTTTSPPTRSGVQSRSPSEILPRALRAKARLPTISRNESSRAAKSLAQHVNDSVTSMPPVGT